MKTYKETPMKLNSKRVVVVGLAFMSISGFWQLYDFIIPLILTNTFSISDTISGIVMSLDNILALILLPLFGSLSDKYSSKIGKRMPFITVGTLLTVIGLLIIPFSVHKESLPLFIFGLSVTLLALSSYRSPAVALMPDVTPKPLRSKGNAIINLMGALGGTAILASLNFFSPEKLNDDHYPIFLFVSGFLLISLFVMLIIVKENKWGQETIEANKIVENKEDFVSESGFLKPEVKKSLAYLLISISLWFMGYNAVISAFSRYAIHELNLLQQQASNILLVANIAAILSFIPIGILSTRFGRKKTILCGITLLFVAFSTAFIYKNGFTPLMFGNFALAGFGWAAINVNSLPMVLEMAKGEEVGKYTGLYYTFSMSAQIITPILSGLLFDIVGYRVLFLYAGFFVLASFISMQFVKHGNAITPDIKLEDFEI